MRLTSLTPRLTQQAEVPAPAPAKPKTLMARLRDKGPAVGKGLLIGGVVVGVAGMAIGGAVGAYIDPLAAGAMALGGGYIGSKVGMLAGAAAAAFWVR
jgi:hypothetical protein